MRVKLMATFKPSWLSSGLGLRLGFGIRLTNNIILATVQIYHDHILTIFAAWPQIFAFKREFPNNTNENWPFDHFLSCFLQESPIDLIHSPESFILLPFNSDQVAQ